MTHTMNFSLTELDLANCNSFHLYKVLGIEKYGFHLPYYDHDHDTGIMLLEYYSRFDKEKE